MLKQPRLSRNNDIRVFLRILGPLLIVLLVLALSILIGKTSEIRSAIRSLVAVSSPQKNEKRDISSEQASIDREFTASGAPSLTMAVAQDGQFLWERSWGWADKEKRIPATPQTMYSLASISKVITAAGLMVLVDRKLVDLNRPIDDYLGATRLRAYVGDARQATVARVAHHTAGLPTHEYSAYIDEGRRLPAFSESIRRYGILVRPPGERFDYSNLGYGLLEQAIVQTSKQDFSTFIRKEVVEPLRLSRLVLGPISGLEKDTAVRYGGDGDALPYYEMDSGGASSFYASAHDLTRFGFLFLGTMEKDQRRILSNESLTEMTRPSVNSPFGLGWQLYNRSKSQILVATGAMDGVGTVLVVVPAKGFVVAGLCNARMDLPVRMAVEIIQKAFPDLGFEPPLGPPQPSPEPIPKTLVGDWAGEISTYKEKRRLRLWIQAGGDAFAQLENEPRVQVSNPSWIDGQFIGSFSGEIDPENLGSPQRLQFLLTPRSRRLEGPIQIRTSRPHRIGNTLSSYLSLQKQE
jgi:CubicO group peptidase (beta-lactamase class C family)